MKTVDQTESSSDTEAVLKVLITTFPGNKDWSFSIPDDDQVQIDRFELAQPEAQETTPFSAIQIKSAIDYAVKNHINMVICADPELDRLALAVRKEVGGDFILLNIHQLAAILFYNWADESREETMVCLKSMHLTDMLENMSQKSETLFFNEIIDPGQLQIHLDKLLESNNTEAICGFNIDQQVYHRDYKFNAIINTLISLEKDLVNDNKTLFDELIRLYQKFGFYKEKTVSVDFSSKTQEKHLHAIMGTIRRNPKALDMIFPISTITDYNNGKKKNFMTDKVFEFPSKNADILKIESLNNISITFVPTESKMIHYASIRIGITAKEQYDIRNKELDREIMRTIQMLNKSL